MESKEYYESFGSYFDSNSSDKLSHPVPGYPEVAANKLAQIWNIMNLNNAKTLGSARNLAKQWYKDSGRNL